MRNREEITAESINEAQAELWRAQTEELQQQKAIVSTVPNPWIDNLPHRKKRRTGLWIFALLVAVLLTVTGIYWFLADDNETDGHFVELEREIETTIPAVAGGDVKLGIQQEHGAELTPQEVFRKVNPAVLVVAAAHKDDSMSIGTGVIFHEDGYFLTNAHVIEGGESCMALLADGRHFEAAMVGFDQKRDVAVLKILDAPKLPAVEIGDSEALEVGETVYAIGNPLGIELRGTFTNGIVSAIDRDVLVGDRTMTLIQTNAAMNEGNSGGPLINAYGQVVGLNTIKMSAGSGETGVEGLGFSIPSRTVEYLANQLLTYGKTLPETSMGILVAPTENMDALQVYNVTEGSCSDKAGLRKGDVILTADGQKIATSHDLLKVRRGHIPGDQMTLTVQRGEETLEIVLILDAAP